MPQKSVPNLQETQDRTLSGFLEASSQLGLSEGIQSPSLRWREPHNPVTTLFKQKAFEPPRTLFNALEVDNGFKLAEPVLRYPFWKSWRSSLAPQVRKPRNLTPTALFFGASAETETEISCYSCLWSVSPLSYKFKGTGTSAVLFTSVSTEHSRMHCIDSKWMFNKYFLK